MKTSITPTQQEQLLDYIDGNLNTAERLRFEEQLKANSNLRQQYNAIKGTEKILKDHLLEQPSENFTQSLMLTLAHQPLPVYVSKKNLFLLMAIMILIGAATVLLSFGLLDNTITTLRLDNIHLLSRYLPQAEPTFSMDIKWITKVIIMLNIIVAWVLLDRTILKPFFTKRMQSQHP